MTTGEAPSVVIACHTERRWASLLQTIDSVRRQDAAVAEIIVAVDHNRPLADRLTAECPAVTVRLNDGDHRGASATRNAGMAAVSTPIAAFLDDDEIAHTDWLRTLVAPFGDASVVGTGGRYVPSWAASKPRWFPDEFGWVVGSSYEGMATRTSEVRNVWSGNMAVRTPEFRRVGGFRVEFSKTGDRSRPEDTDLCIRMSGGDPSRRWMYVPDAIIDHHVPADRSSFGFFLSRCYSEGRGKIEMSRALGPVEPLGNERDFVRSAVRHGIARHLRTGAPGMARAGAILLGLSAAGAGAAAATMSPAGRSAGAA